MVNYSLPQNDKSPERISELQKAQANNVLNMVEGIPLGSNPPDLDRPDPEFVVTLYKALFKRHANIRAVYENSGYKFSNPIPTMETDEVLKMLFGAKTTQAVSFYSPDLGQVLPSGRPTSLADFDRLYQRDPVPETAKTALDDNALINMYLSGSQPDSLKRMTKIPENFPLTDSHLRSVPELASDNLSQAIASGRVYYVDYQALSNLNDGTHPQQRKYLYSPLAAFVVPPQGGRMVPVAIKLHQSAAEKEIYTPVDGWSWKIAATMLRSAGNAHSATISHLCETHLTLEPIAVCSARRLSRKHPVFALIHPHIINTRSINAAAFQVLVGKNQFVDRMAGADIASTIGMVAEHRRNYDFSANTIPKRFVANKTDDTRLIKDYAFRDDSYLIWNAIHSWVGDYLSYYYKNDAIVRADTELQAWAKEIGDYGKIKNFTVNGEGVESLAELIDTITMFIFTAGPQHGAVNFAQRTDMSYAPAAPMGGYIPAIRGKGHTEQDWFNVLPPIDVGLVQLQLTLILGDTYFSKLGGYKEDIFEDAVKPFMKAHQKKLAEIEETIQVRNRSGRKPYIHLLPSNIPQSTNI